MLTLLRPAKHNCQIYLQQLIRHNYAYTARRRQQTEGTKKFVYLLCLGKIPSYSRILIIKTINEHFIIIKSINGEFGVLRSKDRKTRMDIERHCYISIHIFSFLFSINIYQIT